jgi:thioesterase domain-containing protein
VERALAAGLLPADVDADDIRGAVDWSVAALRSMRGYRALPYPGRVAVFRAQDGANEGEASDLGWTAASLGGAEVHLVGGTHVTMMKEPAVADLALHLTAALEAARAARNRKKG